MKKLSVAARVASKFGGGSKLSKVCDVTPSAVCQWELIPNRHHGTILKAAAQKGIVLEDWEVAMLPEEHEEIIAAKVSA